MALATPKFSLFSKPYRSVAFFGEKVFAKWVKMLDKKGEGEIGYPIRVGPNFLNADTCEARDR